MRLRHVNPNIKQLKQLNGIRCLWNLLIFSIADETTTFPLNVATSEFRTIITKDFEDILPRFRTHF